MWYWFQIKGLFWKICKPNGLILRFKSPAFSPENHRIFVFLQGDFQWLLTPTKSTVNNKISSSSILKNHRHFHQKTTESSSSFKARFEAYNRLQAASVAFGEKLPIPEIVAIGGQSDGKSSLLEALLGFRFNVREVEMGTRRPLILQMVHDPTALDPRCRFQEEDSEEYDNPIMSASAVAETIKSRTDTLLKKTKTAVSPKPIVMRAEYAHCPNLTIIDTPGFVLKLVLLVSVDSGQWTVDSGQLT
ncbi:hypothetical protein L2E82_37559 [Cichorium intybus]|uniref:Uncharacterized protein n=1 Tax=Cichorium intybus TaxID=13427 RepID=A0ACB9AFG2_CICIN|nr:hypothetical protein L2E82_37559 [Cichorium intybus]